MVIDFHTHIFPDKIAERTIEFLSQKANIPAYANGTLSGLQAQLKSAKVDFSVALPVLTKPESFDSVLQFAASVNEAFFRGEHDVYSFAGIHPRCEDVEEKLSRIKKAGFKGVKIHPDYQQTFIDDPGYIRILNAAIDEDLIVVTHSGLDVGYPDCIHCTPRRALNALEKVKGDVKLVFAHYGACNMYDEVYELLAGRNVYLDTAYVLDELSPATFKRILEKHGEDKILFASDSPWKDVSTMLRAFFALDLDKQTQEKILYKNALRLLGEDILRKLEV